jgi:hypothetical protein
MAEENKIRDAIEAVTGLAKAVPVYQDLLQPSAIEIGTNLQKAIHMALAPISGMVWGYEKIEEFVKVSVARRLEQVPLERIKTPLPQIAGPTLEALKYTGHDENLREMFSKLLATAIDEKTAMTAHPSFVEIIRQLSSDEAKICKLLKRSHLDSPVVNILEKTGDNRERIYVLNFSTLGYEAGCHFPKMIQRYLDNLDRLALIDVRFDRWIVDDNAYSVIEFHSDYCEIIQKLTDTGKAWRLEKGMILKTNFGVQFFAACVD